MNQRTSQGFHVNGRHNGHKVHAVFHDGHLTVVGLDETSAKRVLDGMFGGGVHGDFKPGEGQMDEPGDPGGPEHPTWHNGEENVRAQNGGAGVPTDQTPKRGAGVPGPKGPATTAQPQPGGAGSRGKPGAVAQAPAIAPPGAPGAPTKKLSMPADRAEEIRAAWGINPGLLADAERSRLVDRGVAEGLIPKPAAGASPHESFYALGSAAPEGWFTQQFSVKAATASGVRNAPAGGAKGKGAKGKGAAADPDALPKAKSQDTAHRDQNFDPEGTNFNQEVPQEGLPFPLPQAPHTNTAPPAVRPGAIARGASTRGTPKAPIRGSVDEGSEEQQDLQDRADEDLTDEELAEKNAPTADAFPAPQTPVVRNVRGAGNSAAVPGAPPKPGSVGKPAPIVSPVARRDRPGATPEAAPTRAAPQVGPEAAAAEESPTIGDEDVEVMAKMSKFRDILTYLVEDRGIRTQSELIEACELVKAEVPTLSRMTDLADRVPRTLDLLEMQLPE